jgi:hypothetical protein
MGVKARHSPGSQRESWIGLALCAAVAAAWTLEQLVPGRPAYAEVLAPDLLPLVAAGLGAAAIVVRAAARPGSLRLQGVLSWGGLLLMLWAAGGLMIDLLRVASLVIPGLMPAGVDWLGLVTRALACAAAFVLAHLALARPSDVTSTRVATWYGYAALALALPYPILKTWWALGGDLGLRWPGADGLAGSFGLWLPAVPWLLAAALSLLLVTTPRRLPRRALLAAGWFASVLVATFGLSACFAFVVGLIRGDVESGGMATWVFGLVYGSWFLWAMAAGAATRSYQLRTATAGATTAVVRPLCRGGRRRIDLEIR